MSFGSIIKRVIQPLIVWLRAVIIPTKEEPGSLTERIPQEHIPEDDDKIEGVPPGNFTPKHQTSTSHLASDDQITVTHVLDDKQNDQPGEKTDSAQDLVAEGGPASEAAGEGELVSEDPNSEKRAALQEETAQAEMPTPNQEDVSLRHSIEAQQDSEYQSDDSHAEAASSNSDQLSDNRSDETSVEVVGQIEDALPQLTIDEDPTTLAETANRLEEDSSSEPAAATDDTGSSEQSIDLTYSAEEDALEIVEATEEEAELTDVASVDSEVVDSEPEMEEATGEPSTADDESATENDVENDVDSEGLPQPLRLLQIDDQPVTLLTLVESLLFVAESAVEPKQFAEVLDVPLEDVQAALNTLAQDYIERSSGLRVQERNGKYSLVSMPLAAQPIEDFLNLDLNSRLSSAALETLAIVAYRQPVTRIQVESVRGVDCGGVLRTLLQRELVTEVGRLDAVGRPILYGVTDLFMQHFGLTTMDELPPLETTDADLLWAATQLAEDEDDNSDDGDDGDHAAEHSSADEQEINNGTDGQASLENVADAEVLANAEPGT